MWLIVTLLWVPWAALAAWMGRQLMLHRSLNTETPEDAARRAYATGAIDRDRYLQVIADLSGGGGAQRQ